jgi:hypothetical protein
MNVVRSGAIYEREIDHRGQINNYLTKVILFCDECH